MSRTQSFLSVLSEINGFGPNPQLPEPDRSLIPTVNVAKAVGWPDGAHPAPAAGTSVVPFAKGLAHPRWLYVLPNGDVLVAETNTPARPAQIRQQIAFRSCAMPMVTARPRSVVRS